MIAVGNDLKPFPTRGRMNIKDCRGDDNPTLRLWMVTRVV